MLNCTRVLMLLGLLAPVARAQVTTIDSVTASTVTEAKGTSSFGTLTLKPEKGVLLEVRARIVLPADGKFTMPLAECVLSGASKGTALRSTWKLSVAAVALRTPSGCNYIDPSSIVKGAVSQNITTGGTIRIARDVENGPVELTFGPGTARTCFVFSAPANPSGPMRLKLGKSEVVVPAVAAK